jgi:hypothetical protein
MLLDEGTFALFVAVLGYNSLTVASCRRRSKRIFAAPHSPGTDDAKSKTDRKYVTGESAIYGTGLIAK